MPLASTNTIVRVNDCLNAGVVDGEEKKQGRAICDLADFISRWADLLTAVIQSGYQHVVVRYARRAYPQVHALLIFGDLTLCLETQHRNTATPRQTLV